MYESIMWTYMKEEKDVLSHLLSISFHNQCSFFDEITSLFITAHGSSFNAALAVSSFFTSLTHIPVSVYTPSDFIHTNPSLDWMDPSHTAVLGISQTGSSRGVLEALAMAKQKEFPIAAVTAAENSLIDRIADKTFYLECGDEQSNAKTKGFSATLLLLMILAMETGKRKGILKDLSVFEKELREEIEAIPSVMKETDLWCRNHSYGKGMKELFVIGSGMNRAIASEGQLKLMETMCIPSAANDMQEFSHGMHRALNPDSHVLLLAGDCDRQLFETTFHYLKKKGIPVLLICGWKDTPKDDAVSAGYYPLTQSVLTITAILQVISAFVPEINGLDPNRDANNDYTEEAETRTALYL